ncbi:MAG: hypothetical protein L0H93_07555 [Nocardioides sp.]|nr:hypothetical protein [Nocardioides sp.]
MTDTVRYVATDPFMAYPAGRLVRLSGNPAEAAVLDDGGQWRRQPSLDWFAEDPVRVPLSPGAAKRLAEYLGHPDAVEDTL